MAGKAAYDGSQANKKISIFKRIKMPKQKSRKSVLKRFRLTKTGKVLRRGMFNRHLKAGKSKKRQRKQKVWKVVPKGFAKKIRKVIYAR